MLLLFGVPERAVMDIMGWSQTAMAARYQHITTELTISIANRVSDLFWEPDESSQHSA